MLNNQKISQNRIINQLTHLQINNHHQKQHQSYKYLITKRIKAKNRFIHIDEDDSYLNFNTTTFRNSHNYLYNSSDPQLKKNCSDSTGVYTTNNSIKKEQVVVNFIEQYFFTPKKESVQNKKLIDNSNNQLQTGKKSEASTCFQSVLEESIEKLKSSHIQPYEIKLKQGSLQEIMQKSQKLQYSYKQEEQILLQRLNQQKYNDQQDSIALFKHSYNTQVIQNLDYTFLSMIDYNNYCFLCDQFGSLCESTHTCRRRIINLSDICRSLQQISTMAERTQMVQYKTYTQMIKKINTYEQLRCIYQLLKIKSQKSQQKQKIKIEQIILRRLINIVGKKMGFVLIL